jgi:hypothetical protein
MRRFMFGTASDVMRVKRDTHGKVGILELQSGGVGMDTVVRLVGGRGRLARAAAVVALSCCAGACGSVMNMMPDPGDFRMPDRSTFLATRSNFNYSISPTGTVGPADLVDGQGRCSAPQGGDAIARNVRLDMTECEVVRALGQPMTVDFPSQAGSDQRRVTLTYKTGERPGIYEFTAGRLTGIERVEESQPPAAARKPAPRRSKPQPPA